MEVAQFGFESQPAFFRSLGCDPALRRTADGAIFVTDNGNYIYDCRFPAINDPAKLAASLKNRAGVVETGLFIGIATIALIADENGVRQISRQGETR